MAHDTGTLNAVARAAAPASAATMAVVFLLSLLVPIIIPVGPLLLMPHRLMLLIFFIPNLIRLYFSTPRPLPMDWLMLASALWAALALLANHGPALVIEPIGIHLLEFLGAYMVGRVSIRSERDFRIFVKTFLVILTVLLPFAALESITRRPILLDLIPNSINAVDAGVRMGMRRAQTVFAHPILFGAFASSGLGLFWFVVRPAGTRVVTVPLVAVLTLFSLSTGAMISLVMQSVFIGWETVMNKMPRRWTVFGWMSAAAYVAIDLLSNRTPFHVLVTYASFNSGSAYNRILIWQYGTDNVWAHPIFGLGLNDWARPSWMSSSMDNFWLVIAVQYGLPAFLFFATAVFLIVRKVALRDFVSPGLRQCQAGFLVAMGGVILAGGTVHYWHGIMAFMLFFFGSGVWMVTAQEDSAEPAQETAAPLVPTSRYTRFPAQTKAAPAVTRSGRSRFHRA